MTALYLQLPNLPKTATTAPYFPTTSHSVAVSESLRDREVTATRCHPDDVIHTLSSSRCHPHDVIHTMSSTRCQPQNVIHTMSATRGRYLASRSPPGEAGEATDTRGRRLTRGSKGHHQTKTLFFINYTNNSWSDRLTSISSRVVLQTHRTTPREQCLPWLKLLKNGPMISMIWAWTVSRPTSALCKKKTWVLAAT
jgi:hypothetical protein